jgi:putative membrane protein
MRGLSIPCRLFLAMVAFSIAGSAFSRLSGHSPGWIAPVAAALTLLTGFWAIVEPILEGGGRRSVAGVLAVMGVGLATELAGITLGMPFGRYAYTSCWWPTLALPGNHLFPVLVPSAWFLLAGGSYLAVCRRWPRAAVWLGPCLAAGIDLGMEPAMTDQLGYWRWLDRGPLPGGAPLANLVGWLATSVVAAVILNRSASPAACARREPAWVLLGYVLLIAFVSIIAPTRP